MAQVRNSEMVAVLEADFLKIPTTINITPTLYQNGAVTHTVNEAHYVLLGQTVQVMVQITADAAGSAGNAVGIILPADLTPTVGNTPLPLGNFTVWDKSAGWYHGFAWYGGLLSGSPIIYGTVHNAGNHIGVIPNFALASTDIVAMNIMYRI